MRLTEVFAARGRAFAVIVLVALVALRMLDPRVINTIRLRGFDLEQELAPRRYQPLPVRFDCCVKRILGGV